MLENITWEQGRLEPQDGIDMIDMHAIGDKKQPGVQQITPILLWTAAEHRSQSKLILPRNRHRFVSFLPSSRLFGPTVRERFFHISRSPLVFPGGGGGFAKVSYCLTNSMAALVSSFFPSLLSEEGLHMTFPLTHVKTVLQNSD